MWESESGDGGLTDEGFSLVEKGAGVAAVMEAVASVVGDEVEEESGLFNFVGDTGLFGGSGASERGVAGGVGDFAWIIEFPGEGAVFIAEGFEGVGCGPIIEE